MVVLDTLLDQRIARLRNDAPSFDRAWREILDSGSPVVIGTREQLESIMPSNVRGSRAWAAITVNWDGNGGHLQRSAVAIRVDWLREIHERYHTPDGAFIEAVDELLIHEIYGHLVPIVIAGTSRASCPDPAPGDRLENSCVGRRELALRAERAEFVAAREPARR